MSYPLPRLVRDGIVVGVASGLPIRQDGLFYLRTLIVMASTRLEPWDRGFYLESHKEELTFASYEQAVTNEHSTIYSGVTFRTVPELWE